MENKNGQGVFLGVVGVATLVVAIIGATFAFFSAQTQSEAGAIQGNTLGGTDGGVLRLAVEKISWADAGASSNDLVPTNITTATAQAAVTAKCVATPGGTDTTKYTGCHLYRIVASAGSNVAQADLSLSSFTLDGVTDKTKWNYAVWSTSDAATASTYTLGTNVATATGTNEVTSSAAKTIFTGQAMTTEESKVYYLLVYVANENVSQNADDSSNVTGSYTGQLTLSATGGSQVMATFSA